jgi:hypothetical protein
MFLCFPTALALLWSLISTGGSLTTMPSLPISGCLGMRRPTLLTRPLCLHDCAHHAVQPRESWCSMPAGCVTRYMSVMFRVWEVKATLYDTYWFTEHLSMLQPMKVICQSQSCITHIDSQGIHVLQQMTIAYHTDVYGRIYSYGNNNNSALKQITWQGRPKARSCLCPRRRGLPAVCVCGGTCQSCGKVW